MREEDKCHIEVSTQTDALPNETNQTENVQSFLPEGQVAIAIIAAPTTKEGKTVLQFDSNVTQLFDIKEAIGGHHYTQQDVGKRVACMRVCHTEQLVILGTMYEGEVNDNKKLLEQLVDHSSHSNIISSSEQSVDDEMKENEITSVFASDNSVLEEKSFKFSNVPSSPSTTFGVITDSNEHIPKQVTLKAEEEITLQCGESYLTLKSDGRIKLNGKNIHSSATKVQRLSGGSIKLN